MIFLVKSIYKLYMQYLPFGIITYKKINFHFNFYFKSLLIIFESNKTRELKYPEFDKLSHSSCVLFVILQIQLFSIAKFSDLKKSTSHFLFVIMFRSSISAIKRQISLEGLDPIKPEIFSLTISILDF